jgi:hypothetical protein
MRYQRCLSLGATGTVVFCSDSPVQEYNDYCGRLDFRWLIDGGWWSFLDLTELSPWPVLN